MARRRFVAEIPALALAAAALCACRDPGGYQPVVAGGSAERGRIALVRYECGACHRVPGIPRAHGSVGPPLEDYGERVYLAGRYPNVPPRLVEWIRHAPALDSRTAMPDLGVTEAEARDIAAYLYE
ncbi:MAG: c-type cytochrome [Steroidobacteraceae bacterium]